MKEKLSDIVSFNSRKITYKGASYAGIAQSVSQASQNAVDLVRHECTIKLTAMGKAYQKLLSNPGENSEVYKEILSSSEDITSNLSELETILAYYANNSYDDDTESQNEDEPNEEESNGLKSTQ